MSPSSPPLILLYVEDDPVNAQLLEAAVKRKSGWAIVVVASGGAALEWTRSQTPALLLLDIDLGDMTGVELARRLRGRAALADVPIVALSADATSVTVKLAMDAGFLDYLTKPVNFRTLFALLDHVAWLSGRGADQGHSPP